MSWDSNLDDEWNLFLVDLENASRNFFLLVYDRPITHRVLINRFKQHFELKTWGFLQVRYSVGLVSYIKERLDSQSAKAIIVYLDEDPQNALLESLNLLREKLFELPTNIVFLAHINIYQKMVTNAYDLLSWINLPYFFELPKIAFPELPAPTLATSENIKEQILYLLSQVQDFLEQGDEGSIVKNLLPSLADLYLVADNMYDTSISIYKFLQAHSLFNNEKEKPIYKQKLQIAQGWELLTKLSLGPLSNQQIEHLDELFNKGIFSIVASSEGWICNDSFGQQKFVTIELLVRLALINQDIYELLKSEDHLLIDPTLLLFESEQAYKLNASRYGIGYNYLDVQAEIFQDGSAQVTRIVNVEAFSSLDSLETTLLIPERVSQERSDSEVLELVKSESLNQNFFIETDKVARTERLSLRMHITPRLRFGDNIKYKIVETAPKRLYAINWPIEDLKTRKTPYDYFGWNIDRPTRHLFLQINFPKGFFPKNCGAEVKYASSGANSFPLDQINRSEQDRLPKHNLEFIDGAYKLNIKISYPTVGLIYILKWKP